MKRTKICLSATSNSLKKGSPSFIELLRMNTSRKPVLDEDLDWQP